VNEHQLRRLLRRVLLSAPLPLAVLGAACGGSSVTDFSGGGAASGGEPSRGGSGGAPSAGASNGGATAIAGSSSAGAGGAIAAAGAGGAVVAGAGAAGAAASAGAGGSSGDSCKNTLALSCNPVTVTIPKTCVDAGQAVLGTQLSQETCKSICNVSYIFSCSVAATTSSAISVSCNPGCAVGRRPEGMLETCAFESNEAGGYFAQIAQLEAASVIAFRVLRDELRAHGAPKALVRAAARAARDEIRHARATGALARRFGGTPRAAAVVRGARRSLEAIALENAVEGCVRETYGALLATRQALLSRDHGVRAAMMLIARDEPRHASLSWRV